jgi:uncharacterized phage protein gp47/JayE
MIDVGHPFSKPFLDLVNALETSLQLGVEQPGSLDVVFLNNRTLVYALKGVGPVSGLADQITGFVDKKPAIFNLGQHYTYKVGQLVWQDPPSSVDPATAAWFPDDNSHLSVGYLYRDLPSGITDYNAGSVAGTLVRAVSREMKLLYEQMDQAYQRAFIDYAQGAALDNVVALLGISRNPALPAQGEVTFSLKKPAKADVPIAIGTRVADTQGRLFKVTAPGIIKANADTSVTVPVIALAAGPEGNLGQGSLTIMPTPPHGVDGGVVNNGALFGGEATEADDQLRERAKHALERAGNATLNAIRYAVLNIQGSGVGGVAVRVDSVEVRDFSMDETIPLGEVWVRFSTQDLTGAVGNAVAQVVERTRAAGIKARVLEVSTVRLSGKFYVIPDVTGSGNAAFASYQAAVAASINALGIGEPVSSRKLAAIVFQIPGLADVADIQLDYVRGSATAEPVDADPFVLGSGEQARTAESAIKVVPVRALAVSAATLAADGTLSATVGAVDDNAGAISFRNFQFAILATVRGKPATTPNQPLQQVGQVVGTVSFANADHASPTFPKLAIPNLASLDPGSIEISVQAAAYPGVLAGTAALAT